MKRLVVIFFVLLPFLAACVRVLPAGVMNPIYEGIYGHEE